MTDTAGGVASAMPPGMSRQVGRDRRHFPYAKVILADDRRPRRVLAGRERGAVGEGEGHAAAGGAEHTTRPCWSPGTAGAAEMAGAVGRGPREGRRTMAPPGDWSERKLQQVRAGMGVYDRHHERVGTVTAVALGGDTTAAARVPAVARRGLVARGFVAIEAGPLAGRCYATAGQLAAVEGERVLLNVGRDYLATH